jgi:RNA polymerase sigma factor (TIGR02999 family)
MANGDPAAADRLLPLVYGELRQLAGGYFRQQGQGHTLQPTALVHEAYLKLVHQPTATFRSRAHFMAVAARAMKQILIDRARRADALARGGGRQRVALDDEAAAKEEAAAFDILALDTIMIRLASLDERKAKVVEMRIFGGMSIEEVSEALDISRTTVTKDWRMARAWLARELQMEDAP